MHAEQHSRLFRLAILFFFFFFDALFFPWVFCLSVLVEYQPAKPPRKQPRQLNCPAGVRAAMLLLCGFKLQPNVALPHLADSRERSCPAPLKRVLNIFRICQRDLSPVGFLASCRLLASPDEHSSREFSAYAPALVDDWLPEARLCLTEMAFT